jgi:iturin family lipopeptide synthetase A
MADLTRRIAALSVPKRALLERRLRGEDAGLTAAGVTVAAPSTTRQPRSATGVQFSLFFFSDNGSTGREGKYDLLLESARFADRNDFCAVWTPERHFHEFGSLYPNPSVLGAALALATRRVGIRAGSVVLPLHHPIRVAEEWAVVDNLSGGRVGVSFASGWHPDDFVLTPEPYAERREVLLRGIQLVQRLWAGEAVPFSLGGVATPIRIFPRPIQARLPFWLTSSGNPATWVKAGKLGANVLTGLMEQSVEDVAQKVCLYRQALQQHGHDPRMGRVTAMVHTYLGDDLTAVREKVRAPMLAYLRSHLGLYEKLASSQDIKVDVERLTADDREALLALGFERYFKTHALMGTPDSCLHMGRRLRAVGVDEIACLINFGLDGDSIMAGLERLNKLRQLCAADSEPAGSETEGTASSLAKVDTVPATSGF